MPSRLLIGLTLNIHPIPCRLHVPHRSQDPARWANPSARGVLAKWHVNDGDTVKKDQPLFELETDKITSEGTAEAAGRVDVQSCRRQ
jgi:hypothetical protein